MKTVIQILLVATLVLRFLDAAETYHDKHSPPYNDSNPTSFEEKFNKNINAPDLDVKKSDDIDV